MQTNQTHKKIYMKQKNSIKNMLATYAKKKIEEEEIYRKDKNKKVHLICSCLFICLFGFCLSTCRTLMSFFFVI